MHELCVGVVALLIVGWTGGLRGVDAGCGEAGNLCCRHHNNSCTALGPRIKGPADKCYCDEYCLSTNDCCIDFTSVCPGKMRCIFCNTFCLSFILLWCEILFYHTAVN
jgi:hypothetical protein